MTYQNNPAEYLNCTDDELESKYAEMEVDEIEASLNNMLPGENNIVLASAIFKQLNF